MRLFLLLFLCLPVVLCGQSQIPVGGSVPDFTVTDINGNTHTLSQITGSGKYVFIHFLADWNVWDEAVASDIETAYQQFGCNTGEVFFIGMNNGPTEAGGIQTWADQNSYSAPIVAESSGSDQVQEDHDIFAFPSLALISPNMTMANQDLYTGPGSTAANIAAVFSTFGIDESPCVFNGGCVDPTAFNYNEEAATDDGSCLYVDCSDLSPLNTLLETAETDLYPSLSFWNFGAPNTSDLLLHAGALIIDEESQFPFPLSQLTITSVDGLPPGFTLSPMNATLASGENTCLTLSGVPTDPSIASIDFTINCSAEVNVFGVTQTFAVSFDHSILVGPVVPGPGCTYPSAINYSPLANAEDGSCLFAGCTQETALNYAPAFNYDDGSCIFPENLCGPGTMWDAATGTCTQACEGDITGDLLIDVLDILALVSNFGVDCE